MRFRTRRRCRCRIHHELQRFFLALTLLQKCDRLFLMREEFGLDEWTRVQLGQFVTALDAIKHLIDNLLPFLCNLLHLSR